MAEGTVQSIEIPASPEFIFEVLADLESYPEWITAMREVEILERDEMGAAALQYVRKVSGFREPAPHNRPAFDAAVAEITVATERLMRALVIRGA